MGHYAFKKSRDRPPNFSRSRKKLVTLLLSFGAACCGGHGSNRVEFQPHFKKVKNVPSLYNMEHSSSQWEQYSEYRLRTHTRTLGPLSAFQPANIN